jgi:Flp pilus assembly pilin Flp
MRRMRHYWGQLARLSRDDRGQMAIEWTLVLVTFALPMLWVFTVLLAVLAEHYRMVTCILTMPLP